MKHVEIFTDGACQGNPGPGGWGAILRFNGVEKEISGGDPDTTNNRMELMAVIRALQCLKEPCAVTLCSDSQYVCNAIEKGWAVKWRQNGWRKADKSPALNTDLWEILLHLLESIAWRSSGCAGTMGIRRTSGATVWPLRAPNAPKPPVQSFDSWRCKRVCPLCLHGPPARILPYFAILQQPLPL